MVVMTWRQLPRFLNGASTLHVIRTTKYVKIAGHRGGRNSEVGVYAFTFCFFILYYLKVLDHVKRNDIIWSRVLRAWDSSTWLRIGQFQTPVLKVVSLNMSPGWTVGLFFGWWWSLLSERRCQNLYNGSNVAANCFSLSSHVYSLSLWLLLSLVTVIPYTLVVRVTTARKLRCGRGAPRDLRRVLGYLMPNTKKKKGFLAVSGVTPATWRGGPDTAASDCPHAISHKNKINKWIISHYLRRFRPRGWSTPNRRRRIPEACFVPSLLLSFIFSGKAEAKAWRLSGFSEASLTLKCTHTPAAVENKPRVAWWR